MEPTKIIVLLKKYLIPIVILLLIVIGSGGYVAGYRLDQAGITRVGTVSISNLPEPTSIYIDQARKVQVTGGTATLSLTPGTHSIIIDSKDNQPWNEIFTVLPAEELVLHPFLIKTSVPHTVLTAADQVRAFADIRKTFLPQKATPLARDNGCTLVYAAGNRIIAEATTTSSCVLPPYLSCSGVSSENPTGGCAPTIIFSPKEQLHAILPYPGREDALVFVAGTHAYVLELDPREPQFIAPIFKGAITGASLFSDSSVVVTNGSDVIELGL